MHELLRFARQLRCDTTDLSEAFAHRLRVGVAVAALILLVSFLR